MTLLDHLARLEKLAEAATPGPWAHSGNERPDYVIAAVDIGGTYAVTFRDRDEDFPVGQQSMRNHAYFAALDPDTVRALIECARCLERIVSHRPAPEFATSRAALAKLGEMGTGAP